MECPVCKFNKPINRWITVKSMPDKTTVAPRISYYPAPGTNQYENLYACPKCGVVKIRKIGDR